MAIVVQCKVCHQDILLDTVTERFFCTHCGSENVLLPPSQDIKELGAYHLAPLERKERFDQLLAENPDDKALQALARIWAIRYKGKVRKGIVPDQFLGFWSMIAIDLNSIGSRGVRNRIKREMEKIFHNREVVALIQENPYGKQVLDEEFYQSARAYLETCKRDNQYASLAMGLMKMSKKSVREKICRDVFILHEIMPQLMEEDLELCRPVADAIYRAMLEVYPDSLSTYESLRSK